MDDRRRFEEWVQRYHGDLYRHAYWMLGDEALAEELVQETFFRAWRGRRRLRRRDAPLPWLLGILRHACFAEIARQGRVGPMPPEATAHDGGETVADLAQALGRLSPAQRDLILMYALHGLSYEEMARQLDVPVGTVMSRLNRARAALRRLWHGDEAARVIPFPRRERRP